jgi:N-acetylmuramoyl-L-alanine amidase CwlA
VADCDWYIPEQTLSLAADFIARLMQIYNIDIDHVIRHYEVTKKQCPRPLCGDDINEYYCISGNKRWAQFKAQIQDKLTQGV